MVLVIGGGGGGGGGGRGGGGGEGGKGKVRRGISSYGRGESLLVCPCV